MQLETIPMYNYPNFLNLFTTFMCEFSIAVGQYDSRCSGCGFPFQFVPALASCAYL